MKIEYGYTEDSGVEAIEMLIGREHDLPWQPARKDGMARALSLLDEIPFLHLRKGYVMKESCISWPGGGMVLTWAIPEGADENMKKDVPIRDLAIPIPDGIPEEGCEGLNVPLPVGASDPMEAIEGDDSPESYLAASLFAREILDAGNLQFNPRSMIWWKYMVLLKDIWADRCKKFLFYPKECWQIEEVPSPWHPVVTIEDDEVTVKFNVYLGRGNKAIYEITDTYQRGKYSFTSEVRRLAVSKRRGR